MAREKDYLRDLGTGKTFNELKQALNPYCTHSAVRTFIQIIVSAPANVIERQLSRADNATLLARIQEVRELLNQREKDHRELLSYLEKSEDTIIICREIVMIHDRLKAKT